MQGWKIMNISDRIFDKLNEMNMSQKEFSDKTGIRQSTISEWKKQHTNPSADKIMVICNVLDVSPEWLLSGTDTESGYRNRMDWFVVDRNSEAGWILERYNKMDVQTRARLKGYMEAISEKEKRED